LAMLVTLGIVLSSCGEKEEAPAPAASRAKPSAREKPFTVAFVGYSSTNVFWITLRQSAEERAKELGARFEDLTAADPEMSLQKNAIDNAILKGVDGLLIGAVDSRGLRDSFDKAQQAGIPIVTVDTEVKHPAVRSHIATNNIAAATLAGNYIVERLGGKGKVLILGGIPGSQTADDRRKGVADACEAAGMEVIVRPADWLEAKANEVAQNELDRDSTIGAIFAACDPMIMAAKQVVKHKGLRDQIVLVGFDAIPQCLNAIKKGEVDATVRQDPRRMGREGMELLLKHLKGEQAPRYVPIEAQIIDKNNVDQYITQ